MTKKIQRGMLFVQEKRIWTTKNIRRQSSVSKKSCKAQRKSGNSDSSNNRLAHPKETLDNETQQATTRSGHYGRGQAKVQTELTCAVFQAERILNMREVGYEIHMSEFFIQIWRNNSYIVQH